MSLDLVVVHAKFGSQFVQLASTIGQARTTEGLQVLNFNLDDIPVQPTGIREFLTQLCLGGSNLFYAKCLYTQAAEAPWLWITSVKSRYFEICLWFGLNLSLYATNVSKARRKTEDKQYLNFISKFHQF